MSERAFYDLIAREKEGSLLDMYNSGMVILDAHTEKSGENEKGSLHQLREIVPLDVTIDIRSDAVQSLIMKL